jgi:RNA polymerase sigma-70 factor (ECF subfamily)
VPAALAAFDGVFMPRLSDFLASLRPTASFVDDVSQLVRERLFVGASRKILEYSGTGPLGAWLRVVVVRTAINVKRGRGEEGQRELDPERDLLGVATSPESQILRVRYRPLFADAFAEALTALSADERNLLRLHYVDGLAVDELCRLFSVTRSTIYRRLEACTRTLLERMRDRLGDRLGLSAREFDSLANAVKSDLDVSLGGLLRSQL